MRTFVEIKNSTVGFHKWPDAPGQVAFLQSRHRHTFHMWVRVAVGHGDRAVEFVLLKKDVQQGMLYLYSKEFDKEAWAFDFGHRSCEMIAQEIGEYLRDKLGYKIVQVRVSEDDEFHGIVEWPLSEN